MLFFGLSIFIYSPDQINISCVPQIVHKVFDAFETALDAVNYFDLIRKYINNISKTEELLNIVICHVMAAKRIYLMLNCRYSEGVCHAFLG